MQLTTASPEFRARLPALWSWTAVTTKLLAHRCSASRMWKARRPRARHGRFPTHRSEGKYPRIVQQARPALGHTVLRGQPPDSGANHPPVASPTHRENACDALRGRSSPQSAAKSPGGIARSLLVAHPRGIHGLPQPAVAACLRCPAPGPPACSDAERGRFSFRLVQRRSRPFARDLNASIIHKPSPMNAGERTRTSGSTPPTQ